ncbi:helix-turn-helix transcriptional regulator [Amaricoccus macauensis]|uniref:helix-turn-helix transcriptional regulator n=1 Tax=Amaricoccus macauensis TaxID=57001 RepID=UPI003C7E9332
MTAVVLGQVVFDEFKVVEVDAALAFGEDRLSREGAIQLAIRGLSRIGSRWVGETGPPGRERDVFVDSGAGEVGAAWFLSEKCMIGLWRKRMERVPFVALVQLDTDQKFTAAQRDVARIGLIYERDRLDWAARNRNGSAEPRPPGIDLAALQLGLGLILVDRNRRVISANGVAQTWLDGDRSISVRGGRIVAEDSRSNRRLADAVRMACSGRLERENVLLLGQAGAARPDVIYCLPYQSKSDHALLAVFGARGESSEMTNLLLCAFGLTHSERRLAQHLIAGRSLKDAASECNITLSTARSYLKRIYCKVGVNRQSELVAMVNGLVPPYLPDYQPDLVEAFQA